MVEGGGPLCEGAHTVPALSRLPARLFDRFLLVGGQWQPGEPPLKMFPLLLEKSGKCLKSGQFWSVCCFARPFCRFYFKQRLSLIVRFPEVQ